MVRGEPWLQTVTVEQMVAWQRLHTCSLVLLLAFRFPGPYGLALILFELSFGYAFQTDTTFPAFIIVVLIAVYILRSHDVVYPVQQTLTDGG